MRCPRHVIVRGSVWPLALMMAIFLTKYVASVVLAVQPQLHASVPFTVTVCALFGLFNGYFAGHLARDLKACQGFKGPQGAGHAV